MAKKKIKPETAQNGVVIQNKAEPTLTENNTGTSKWLVKSNDWFKLHIKWVLLVLILCWAGGRVSYFNSIVKSPLYTYYKIDESDNRFFDDWAKELNKDWLNEKPIHPYHSWHKAYADYYFGKHPEKLKEILAANPGKDSSFVPEKVLWNEWYRGNQYHQEPLYPYTLAILYHFNIDAVKAMILLQLLFGVLSGVLLFLIARKYFGETVAVLTGVLYFLCGVLMYNEIVLLRTSWIVFLTVLVVFMIDRALSNPKPKAFLLCGLSIGFAFLMQSTFVLYLIGVLAIMFFTRQQKWIVYLKNSGLLLLGFLIMFSPVIIRNKIVGAPTFSSSSVGIADIIACNVFETKSISSWTPSAAKETEILGESYNSLGDAVVATLKTHPSIISYCSLELQKLKAAWIGIEYPNNENYYFYKQYVPALKFTVVDFFLLAPLGLAGLIFCLYYRKKYYALYLAISVQIITILIVFVLARFRAPLVILFIPLSAYAIVECINNWDNRKSITFIKAGLVAFFIYLSFLGYSSETKENMVTDGNYATLYYTYFKNKLDKYEETKQWGNWLAFQKQIIDMEPDFIRKISPNEVLDNINGVRILQYFDVMHGQRSDIYDSLGDKAEASKELDTFKILDGIVTNSLKNMHEIVANTDSVNFINLAVSFKGKGQYDSSIIYFKKALAFGPNNIDLQKNVGNGYLDYQKYDSAEAYFKKILTSNPNDPDAINGMGCIYFVRKDYPKAADEYKKSVALDPKHVKAYSNLGRTYFVMEQYKHALEAFGKAHTLDPQNMDDIGFMITSFQKTGKTDSVKKYEAISKKSGKNQ